MSEIFSRIRNELHPSVHHDPVAVLENIMIQGKWHKRLLDHGAIKPTAKVQIPKNPHAIVPETIVLQLRWSRQVQPGVLMRCGANMDPFTDVEVRLLSMASLRERMETWFAEVLQRV